ncbi:hypothetical protein GJAV_G00146430, partial [Gymnothorax javanicus]
MLEPCQKKMPKEQSKVASGGRSVWPNSAPGGGPSSPTFRLVDGPDQCSGRIEVHDGSTNSTVCDADFTQMLAEFVCMELDCGAPEKWGATLFGQGEGQLTPSQNQSCSHRNDVGLVCSGPSTPNVRLVDGADQCSGRVEVRNGSLWGTVCDADFDQLDAEVVCSELGRGVPKKWGAAVFGQGEGQMWTEEIQCRGNESQIYSCPKAPSQNQPCSHRNDVGLKCSGIMDVRLKDGGKLCEGRVEVYHEGQWGTVCDDNWQKTHAGVVCRQLGCGDVAVHGTSSFGPGSGKIWIDEISCKGSESTLKDCGIPEWGKHDCDHVEDIGVVCSANAPQNVRLVDGADLCSGRVEVRNGTSYSRVCDADFDQQDAQVMCRELGCGVPKEWGAAVFGQGEGQMWTEEIQCRGNKSQIYSCPTAPSQNLSCSHRNDVGLICSVYTESKLIDGPDRCSGRVELQCLGTWGTVFDACWDSRASNVLCEQLTCGTAVAVLGQAWFGKGSGQTRGDVFDCHGNETSISQCAISSWSRAVFSDTEVAGVICSDSVLASLNGTVRLAGGSECMGQVEVYYQGNWSRVVGIWSSREASVACRQLGCGSVVQVKRSSPPGSGGSDVCVSGIQCSGEEPHLGNCSAPHKLTCGSQEQVTIVCSNSGHRSLRLVGGGGDCAGRLEVFHRGSWGTVCDDSWDLADAQVVCRQLQCGTALSAPVPSFFGPGKGHVWLEEVGCVGNETSLWDCPIAEWGRSYCGHKEDVGVVCSEFKEMRLTDGCSGNLEVFYNGTWGNVCFNGMDRETATLICQELNCGKSSDVDQKEPR